MSLSFKPQLPGSSLNVGQLAHCSVPEIFSILEKEGIKIDNTEGICFSSLRRYKPHHTLEQRAFVPASKKLQIETINQAISAARVECFIEGMAALAIHLHEKADVHDAVFISLLQINGFDGEQESQVVANILCAVQRLAGQTAIIFRTLYPVEWMNENSKIMYSIVGFKNAH